MEELIRQRVLKTVAERYAVGGSVAAYPASGGRFPYEMEGELAPTPEDINPLQDYVKNFQAFSANDEVYEFPKEEFFLGLRIERERQPEDSILTVAERVLEQLKADPQFYSNLK